MWRLQALLGGSHPAGLSPAGSPLHTRAVLVLCLLCPRISAQMGPALRGPFRARLSHQMVEAVAPAPPGRGQGCRPACPPVCPAAAPRWCPVGLLTHCGPGPGAWTRVPRRRACSDPAHGRSVRPGFLTGWPHGLCPWNCRALTVQRAVSRMNPTSFLLGRSLSLTGILTGNDFPKCV